MQLAGEKYGLCYVLAEAACPVAITISDMDAAAKYVAHLLSASEALDLTYWKSLARCLEGVFLVKQGNHDAGVAALRASLAVCDEAGGVTRYPAFLGAMADGLAELGRIDDARVTLERAMARADRDGEEWCLPDLLCKKGELILRGAGATSDHADNAERCFRDAIDLAQRQGALLWELRGARCLAGLRLAQKRPNDARQILAPVYGRFVEGFETPDLCEAKLLLGSLLLPTERGH
jgi:tetratricopeptide (TPR) repeat protein